MTRTREPKQPHEKGQTPNKSFTFLPFLPINFIRLTEDTEDETNEWITTDLRGCRATKGFHWQTNYIFIDQQILAAP